jgi:hypothetical protein
MPIHRKDICTVSLGLLMFLDIDDPLLSVNEGDLSLGSLVLAYTLQYAKVPLTITISSSLRTGNALTPYLLRKSLDKCALINL